ncbi:MAG TPA: SRPBCC family protein [Acidimicrobiales bacterium]|nr:SRPBCC family protein [Acidimicrobiales bacterium]
MASTVRDRQRGEDKDTKQNGDGDSAPKSGKGRSGKLVKSSHIITEHIDVGVPADVAFEQWTQYEKWSEIFKKESADRGDKSGRGRKGQGEGGKGDVKVSAKIGPSQREWTAEIGDVEQGHRIRWRSKGPLKARGTTTFHRLDDRLTRIMVEIEYQPTGALETIGNFFRMQRRRVRRDLRLFKHYIELRGHAGEQDQDEEES